MIVKEKIKLDFDIYGAIWLKRWDTEEGFYIEWISNTEYDIPKVYSKGLTLQECIDRITDECPIDKKILFSICIDEIIETFSLIDDDKKYLIQLDEWCNF